MLATLDVCEGKSLLNPLTFGPVSKFHPELQNRLYYTSNFDEWCKTPPGVVLQGCFAYLAASVEVDGHVRLGCPAEWD